jgi:hypothetical protein
MQSTSGISAAGQIYESEYYRAWDPYYEETREDHEGRREEAYRLARSLLLDCGSKLEVFKGCRVIPYVHIIAPGR